MYWEVGKYLDANYSKLVIASERKLFPCRKKETVRNLRDTYPKCVVHPPFIASEESIEVFCQLFVEDIKKRHPEIIMEAFLCKDED
jgi:hypothetical protein